MFLDKSSYRDPPPPQAPKLVQCKTLLAMIAISAV